MKTLPMHAMIILGAGLLMGLTPAPTNAWPLTWITLAPLWLTLQNPKSPSTSLRAGKLQNPLFLSALWGLGYQGLALSWLTHLHPLMWLGIPWALSIAITAFAWAFGSLWGVALVIAWSSGLTAIQRWVSLTPWARVLVGTSLWCGLEALWSLGPLYWSSLSYTQSPYNLAVLHLGQLSGQLTVTAAIVAVNGLLAETIRAWWQTRERFSGSSQGQTVWSVKPLAGATLAVLLGVHLIGFSLYSQPLADAPAAVIKVGIIQGNVPTREKLSMQGIRQAREKYLQGYQALAAAGVDAVLTPEGAIPEIWDPFTQETNLFYKAVQPNQAALWLGTFVVAPTENFHITQTLLSVVPGVTKLSQYNKIKLVPLGEYIPLQSILGEFISRLSPLDTSMIPGKTDQQFQSGFGPAAVGICYDSAYGWVFRNQVARGGEFIITASNNDPYPLQMMAQHHAQDVMRAIETDRWAVRGTNTGLSGIVNPHGQTVWLSTPNQFITHADTLYRRQTQTLYVRWGDWLTPSLLAISLGYLIWKKVNQ
ncbi:MAG: apolipoprotein N-acyltransferase [Cyanobacteria bacterium P01_F01_bin.4]